MKLMLLPTLSALAFLAACEKPPEAKHEGGPPPQPVTLAAVEEKPLVEWGEFAGRIDAIESVELRPRVSGLLTEVRFQSGALVKEGDVLFVIDPRPFQAVVDKAKGEEKRAEAQVKSAKKEFDRAGPLLAAKAISPEQAEAREAAHLQADANLAAAQAGVRAAELDLEFSEVRAPISGRVSRALVTAGNFVSGMPGSATLLTTIVSTGPVYAYVDMDENTLLQVQELIRGKKMTLDSEGRVPADVQLSGETGWPHPGWIESFDNRLDMGTGSTVVRVQLPNKEGKLTPGLFARVRLPLTAKHPLLLVDESAIGTDQSKKFVMTVNAQNLAEYRTVVPGPQIEGKRVIREGLKPGERYIANGQGRVFFPGQPVIEDKTPAGAKNTASNP
jgi:RND family efflux transporter MFP subunit